MPPCRLRFLISSVTAERTDNSSEPSYLLSFLQRKDGVRDGESRNVRSRERLGHGLEERREERHGNLQYLACRGMLSPFPHLLVPGANLNRGSNQPQHPIQRCCLT
jgi:hypothetical protein